MTPDGYFEKVIQENGTEVLENRPRFDNTIVVRRKPSVKKETPKPTEELIVIAPEPIGDLRKIEIDV